MASIPFNAFQAARALESAGVERTQAEAIAEAIQQGQYHATRGDVPRVRDPMEELRAHMAAFEKRFTTHLYGLGIGLAAWIIAVELFAWPQRTRHASKRTH